MSLTDRLTRVTGRDDRVVAALTFGTAGLFFFSVLFGPVAIVLGVRAARRHPATRRDRIGALLGIALGVADLVVFAVLMANQVHGGSLDLHI